MNPPLLTVAICTRNPRRDYLQRVLAAIAAQTLPPDRFELLLVDSASVPPLELGLLPPPGLATRVIRLEISGVLRARIAAIHAARAPLLVYLDDDNVPAPDFLERGLALGHSRPDLGCWGPGIITPECESPPDPGVAENLNRMACCNFPTDRWSNTLDVVPPGAGLFLRTELARAYAAMVLGDARRGLVGESADHFFRGDDTDIVFHIVKAGHAAGQFRALQLTHLMPKGRLTTAYIVKLAKAAAGSAMVINQLWGVPPRRESRLDRLVYGLKSLRFRGLDRRIARAHREGEAEARLLLAGLPK